MGKKVKVLGINGSHRKGNTLKLLEIVMANIKDSENVSFEKEIVSLADYDITYCKVCNACKANGGECVVKDGYMELSEKLKEADVIIAGSPVYFGSVSGKLKSLFDRSRSLRVNWQLKGKLCGAVAVGATMHGGQEHTVQAIHAWALIHGMLVIPDAPPTSHFGCVAWSTKEGIHEAGIKTAENLGKFISEYFSERA